MSILPKVMSHKAREVSVKDIKNYIVASFSSVNKRALESDSTKAALTYLDLAEQAYQSFLNNCAVYKLEEQNSMMQANVYKIKDYVKQMTDYINSKDVLSRLSELKTEVEKADEALDAFKEAEVEYENIVKLNESELHRLIDEINQHQSASFGYDQQLKTMQAELETKTNNIKELDNTLKSIESYALSKKIFEDKAVERENVLLRFSTVSEEKRKMETELSNAKITKLQLEKAYSDADMHLKNQQDRTIRSKDENIKFDNASRKIQILEEIRKEFESLADIKALENNIASINQDISDSFNILLKTKESLKNACDAKNLEKNLVVSELENAPNLLNVYLSQKEKLNKKFFDIKKLLALTEKDLNSKVFNAKIYKKVVQSIMSMVGISIFAMLGLRILTF